MTTTPLRQCPNCRISKPLAAFVPSWVCGSPDEPYHRLCLPCQARVRDTWSRRLHWYFELMEDVAA